MTALGLICIPWAPELRLPDAAHGAALGSQGPVEMGRGGKLGEGRPSSDASVASGTVGSIKSATP